MHGFAIIVGQQGLNFCRSSFSIFIQAIVAGEYSRIHLEMKQGMIQWQQSKQVKLQSEKEKETGFTHSPFMELGYLNFPTFSPADGSVIAWGILCPPPPPPPLPTPHPLIRLPVVYYLVLSLGTPFLLYKSSCPLGLGHPTCKPKGNMLNQPVPLCTYPFTTSYPPFLPSSSLPTHDV